MHPRRDLLFVVILLLCIPCLALGLLGSFFHSIDQKLFPSAEQKNSGYTAFIAQHEPELLAAPPGSRLDGVLSISESHGATVFVMDDLLGLFPSGFYYSPQDIPLPIFLAEDAACTATELGWQYESLSAYYADRCLTHRLTPRWFYFEQYTIER